MTGPKDALLTPLMLPRRAVRDLEAIGAAARSMPAFERALIDHLDALGADVRGMRAELNDSIARLAKDLERLDRRVTALQVDLSGELATTNSLVADLKDQVTDAVEHLPDPDSRGPIARARDAIAGTEPTGEA